MTEKGHSPVLVKEVLEFLDADRDGIYVDCTVGLAGHALAILERNPRSFIIGLDRDELSLRLASKRLASFSKRVKLFHIDFRSIEELKLDFSKIRGFLMDLGISSYQLDSPQRGFSFNLEGPLDMRMDQRGNITAARIIQTYPEQKLADVLARYGELNKTRVLAREIVSLRKLGKLKSTVELREVVEKIYNWRPQKGKIHPAAKVFQALRIEVNQELERIKECLEYIITSAVPGTRFVAISFHSLEDRIIKQSFASLAKPENRSPAIKLLTRKPVMATEDEIKLNSRARSAKLRAAQRI